MSRPPNLFKAIIAQGTDLGFVPRVTDQFCPTTAQAGSPEKIRVLRWRLEHGLPLWHALDGEAQSSRRQQSDDFPPASAAAGGDDFL
jgi:hypothetical protein